MKFKPIIHPALVLAALVFVLASCSATDNRISERQAAYSGLSNTQKSLVSQGKIAQGMSKDAVYIALGNPIKTENRGNIEYWHYRRTESQQLPTFWAAPARYRLYHGNDDLYNVTTDFIVRFDQSGRVIDWQ
jgi:outer membrane protein assembly factor BamE (lipoprotein component of BamABCDE complex)